VTYEEAEMAEEEEEEMEEEEEEEEEMEEEMTVRCGSKRLTATISTVALPSPPPLDNSFVERVVFYRFPLEGWLRGVAVEQCAPGAEKDDDGDECNFLIYYESDDTEVPTCLAAAHYDSREDAPFGSWYVEPGGMGGGGGGGFGGGGGDGGGPSAPNPTGASRDVVEDTVEDSVRLDRLRDQTASGAAEQVTAFVPGFHDDLDGFAIESAEVEAFGESKSLELLETHAEEQELDEMGANMRTSRSFGKRLRRWNSEEEAKLKKAKLKVEEKGLRGKWQAIADELGTSRTPAGIKEHWYAMNEKRKREEANEGLDGDGNAGSEDREVEVAQQEQEAQEQQAEQQKAQQKTQQRAQQGAPAEQQEAQAAQVVDATSSVPLPQPERKQARACELVLTPLGDDAREEVGTES